MSRKSGSILYPGHNHMGLKIHISIAQFKLTRHELSFISQNFQSISWGSLAWAFFSSIIVLPHLFKAVQFYFLQSGRKQLLLGPILLCELMHLFVAFVPPLGHSGLNSAPSTNKHFNFPLLEATQLTSSSSSHPTWNWYPFLWNHQYHTHNFYARNINRMQEFSF